MIFFLIYTLLIIYFGKSGFYDTCNAKDFFIANYSLDLSLSVSTFVATWFSAASFLGLGSSLYIYGISAIIYSIVPWFTGGLFLLLLVPSLKEYKVLTFSELLYVKYKSQLLKFLTAGVIIIAYTLYITMQIKGFGIVMELLLEIPYNLAILLVYLYILYTTFGGLYSIAKSDIINTIIILFSTIIFGITVLLHCQGVENIIYKAKSIESIAVLGWNIKTPKGGLLHPFCKGLQPPLYLLTSFFGWGLGLAANPQYIMRIISARNKKVAKKMIVLSLSLLTIIYLFMTIGAIGLRTLIPTAPSVKNVDEIIPLLFSRIEENYLVGFILVGIIAASVSTANSELLLVANTFTYDILSFFWKKHIIDDDHMLFLNRITVAIVGTISLLLSLNPPEKLIQFGGNIWGIFTVTSFIPLYAGTFFKNISKRSVEISSLVGIISYVIFLTLPSFIPNEIVIGGDIHPASFAFVISLITFLIIEGRYKYAKYRK